MDLPKLCFPEYPLKIVSSGSTGQSSKIFDTIRRKYVALTPEEWVRQHLIQYFVSEKKYPASLMAVEKSLKVNELSRRTDIVVYNNKLQPLLIAECKAPGIEINQQVFDQAARYNLSLDVRYFVLTNGLNIYCCTMDHEKREYRFLETVPAYDKL